MSRAPQMVRALFELLDAAPVVNVAEAEYRRLLGYPPGHVPGARAEELAAAARRYYAANGRPWVYVREVELYASEQTLRLDGIEFHSRHLLDYLRQAGATRAVLAAVSAGSSCELHARKLWEESKPDEYFFLEVLGSAVVEHLVAGISGRICALAETEGLIAVPHYSPGYSGWDISDQPRLFDLITRGMAKPFPEPLEVMSSGMLNPKKSMLAVVGLTARTPQSLASPRLVPCESCSFSPCQYRRAPYRHAPAPAGRAAEREVAPAARAASYSVNSRALRKWAKERVSIDYREDGAVDACFRFDGTTCSNQGRPLAFDYRVSLQASRDGYTITGSDCRPAADDDGHKFMCAYLSDGDALMEEISEEKPLLGRPLHDVLTWDRAAVPSGCYCSADSRAHKWGMALEVIHFALAQAGEEAPSKNIPNSR
jgi:hypothetical protein